MDGEVYKKDGQGDECSVSSSLPRRRIDDRGIKGKRRRHQIFLDSKEKNLFSAALVVLDHTSLTL